MLTFVAGAMPIKRPYHEHLADVYELPGLHCKVVCGSCVKIVHIVTIKTFFLIVNP